MPDEELKIPTMLPEMSESPLGNPDSMALDLAGDLRNAANALYNALADGDPKTAFPLLQKVNESSAELMKGFHFLNEEAGRSPAFDHSQLQPVTCPDDEDETDGGPNLGNPNYPGYKF